MNASKPADPLDLHLLRLGKLHDLKALTRRTIARMDLDAKLKLLADINRKLGIEPIGDTIPIVLGDD